MNRHQFSALAAAVTAGFLFSGAAFPGVAVADQINTAGETGAYHGQFCPRLQEALKKSQFDYTCTTSEGSRDNMQRVIGSPSQIGFSQLDVFADESAMLGGDELFTTLRTDIGRECLFMVTRNKNLESYGQVAALAADLRFILPPRKSGSTATFEFLQRIDPDGLGQANNIFYADDTDDALRRALSAEDAVALFVQFPDPANERFKIVNDADGQFLPVLDRKILREQVGEEKIYFAEETEISNAKWNKSGEKVVTACTPIVLFTGKPERLGNETARKDQEDLIRTVRDIALADLQPKQGFLSRLWQRTKQISAKSVEKLVDMSEKARDAAQPYVDQAKDASQPYVDKTKEVAKDAYGRAKEAGKEAIEKSGEMLDEARKKLQTQ